MTHLIVHAVGWAAYKQRRDIGRILFGFFKPEKSIGITVLCDQGGGKDLVPVTIWDVHQKEVKDIALELNGKVGKAKNNKDKEFNEGTKFFKYVPTFILQLGLHMLSYVAANLEMTVPGSGVNPSRYGHIMITNVGTLDIEMALAPLCSPTYAMLIICFGKIVKKPVYDEKQDKIVAKEIMTGVFTFDHRYGDAALSA